MDTGEKERRMNKRRLKVHDVGCYVPSPLEIRRACKRIQAKWSPQEEAARRDARDVFLTTQMIEPMFAKSGSSHD